MCRVTLFLFCILFHGLATNEVLAESESSQHLTSHDNLDLSAWHHRYKDLCYFPGRNNPANENTITIKQILNELEKEPVFARYLLDKARRMNTAFCIEDRADETQGYYDYKYNVIAIRKHLDTMTKVVILFHELRHVDHFSKGFCQSLDYDQFEMVRQMHALEADINAVTALFAWRLKENGYPQIWSKLLGLPNYSDIFQRFETEIETSKDELAATRMAFSQWYKSEWRTTNYYRHCISGYHDMLNDTKLIQRYDKLPEGHFRNLCTVPDGRNYGCHLTTEVLR